MYSAPLDQMTFLLNEVLAEDDSFADIVPSLLEAANKIARDKLAPLNISGDQEGVKIDSTGQVITANGFKEVYQDFVEGGWGSLQFQSKYGGQELPFSIAISIQEMWHSANMSWGLCPLLTQGAVEGILSGANDELKKIFLPKMISGQWTGTMNLTEPHAGTDVGALKTKAWRDGEHYRIKGQKIFITWGDHDMSENIIHLVLARLPDAPAGVKGISLFLVPKILVDNEGNITEPNDCKVLSVEKKIGIHASPTCVMSYGDDKGAKAHLIGEEHKGIQYMFSVMNNARLTVGLQGVSIAERALQSTQSYTNERVQGVAPGFSEAGPINRHPDVIRMLNLMRVLTEAGRTLTYSASAEVDKSTNTTNSTQLTQHQRRIGLLIPMVKAWCTELAQEVVTLGVQCHGGAGFIEETGIGQLYRDVRILPIYEGTNGVQAMDLILRKTPSEDGLAFAELLGEMKQIRTKSILNTVQNSQYQSSLKALEDCVNIILREKNDKRKLGFVAWDFLMLSSLVTASWMLLNVAIKSSKLKANSEYSEVFLQQRVEAAALFIDLVLPRVQTHHTLITNGLSE